MNGVTILKVLIVNNKSIYLQEYMENNCGNDSCKMECKWNQLPQGLKERKKYRRQMAKLKDQGLEIQVYLNVQHINTGTAVIKQ